MIILNNKTNTCATSTQVKKQNITSTLEMPQPLLAFLALGETTLPPPDFCFTNPLAFLNTFAINVCVKAKGEKES